MQVPLPSPFSFDLNFFDLTNEYVNKLKPKLIDGTVFHAVSAVALAAITFYAGQAPLVLGAIIVGAAVIGSYLGINKIITPLDKKELPDYAFPWQTAAFSVATVAFLVLSLHFNTAFPIFSTPFFAAGAVYALLKAIVLYKRNRAEAELSFAKTQEDFPEKALYWVEMAASRSYPPAYEEKVFAKLRVTMHRFNQMDDSSQSRELQMRKIMDIILSVQRDFNLLYEEFAILSPNVVYREHPRLRHIIQGKNFTFADVLEFAEQNQEEFTTLAHLSKIPNRY